MYEREFCLSCGRWKMPGPDLFCARCRMLDAAERDAAERDEPDLDVATLWQDLGENGGG